MLLQEIDVNENGDGKLDIEFCMKAAFRRPGGADEKLDCSRYQQEANMYSEEQYYKALALYDECGSVTKTITQLGYPARHQNLYNWRGGGADKI